MNRQTAITHPTGGKPRNFVGRNPHFEGQIGDFEGTSWPLRGSALTPLNRSWFKHLAPKSALLRGFVGKKVPPGGEGHRIVPAGKRKFSLAFCRC